MRYWRLRASSEVVLLAMNIEEPLDSVFQSSVLASMAGIKVSTILHSESNVSYNIALKNQSYPTSTSMLAESYLGIAQSV